MGTYSSATAWWLGDWLLFGRMKYGRRYKDAVAVTGFDYQTLRNYAMVARRFEPSRRRDTLTFQHHAEVCSLDDETQDRWLRRAEDERWSRNDLRRALRASLVRGDARQSAVVRLEVAHARAALWQDAARRSDVRLDAWICEVLDEAAARGGVRALPAER